MRNGKKTGKTVEIRKGIERIEVEREGKANVTDLGFDEEAQFDETFDDETKEKPKVEVQNKTQTPSFKDIISVFSSSGACSGPDARTALTKFFKSGKLPTSPVPSQPEPVWLTLLALYILDTKFYDRETEYSLIA